jgi:hypothetical protein
LKSLRATRAKRRRAMSEGAELEYHTTQKATSKRSRSFPESDVSAVSGNILVLAPQSALAASGCIRLRFTRGEHGGTDNAGIVPQLSRDDFSQAKGREQTLTHYRSDFIEH